MKRGAAGDPFGRKLHGFSPARPHVFRKDSQPNAPGLRLVEHGIDDLRQERAAIPEGRRRNGNSLHERDALRGGPITHDGKADPLGAVASDEVGMTAIGKGGAVLGLLPSADEIFEADGRRPSTAP